LVSVSDKRITVSDDGMGLFGIGELVDELGGRLSITSNCNGTTVEVALP